MYFEEKRLTADSKHSLGARTVPAPIWPPPEPAIPMSIIGKTPLSQTLKISIPVGVPRNFRKGILKIGFSP